MKNSTLICTAMLCLAASATAQTRFLVHSGEEGAPKWAASVPGTVINLKSFNRTLNVDLSARGAANDEIWIIGDNFETTGQTTVRTGVKVFGGFAGHHSRTRLRNAKLAQHGYGCQCTD